MGIAAQKGNQSPFESVFKLMDPAFFLTFAGGIRIFEKKQGSSAA